MKASSRSMILAFLFLIIGCGDAASNDPATSIEEQRADGSYTASGKADETGSCVGVCGGQSSTNGCWCDTQCESYGDCCSDYLAVCVEPGTGGSTDGGDTGGSGTYSPVSVTGGSVYSAADLHGALSIYSGSSVSSVGIPQYLTSSSSKVGMFWDFGNGNGVNGSGIHIGNGYLVTARHVAYGWMGDDTIDADQELVGTYSFSSYRQDWTLRAMAETGSLYPSRRPLFSPSDYGSWNDLVLLHSPGLIGEPAVDGIRPISDLALGERVWVIGDKTGERTRVSTGKLGDVSGNNGALVEIAVEGGFSGSPVLDVHGNFVGVTSVEMSNGNVIIVNAEVLIDLLGKVHSTFGDAPLDN